MLLLHIVALIQAVTWCERRKNTLHQVRPKRARCSYGLWRWRGRTNAVCYEWRQSICVGPPF